MVVHLVFLGVTLSSLRLLAAQRLAYNEHCLPHLPYNVSAVITLEHSQLLFLSSVQFALTLKVEHCRLGLSFPRGAIFCHPPYTSDSMETLCSISRLLPPCFREVLVA